MADSILIEHTTFGLMGPIVHTPTRVPDVFIGIKDSSGILGRVSEHRAKVGREFIQLIGNDEIALAYNAMGGVGCGEVGVPGLKCTSGEERHWTRRAYGTGQEVPA